MVELNQLKKQQNRKNMKCKVASKVIAASMAVAMVITMAGCGSSGKKVEATKIDVTFDQIEFRKNLLRRIVNNVKKKKKQIE